MIYCLRSSIRYWESLQRAHRSWKKSLWVDRWPCWSYCSVHPLTVAEMLGENEDSNRTNWDSRQTSAVWMKMEINMGMNMGIQRWMLSISSSVFFEEISSQDLSLAVVEGATYVQLTTVRTTLVEWWAGSETKDGAVMTSWPRLDASHVLVPSTIMQESKTCRIYIPRFSCLGPHFWCLKSLVPWLYIPNIHIYIIIYKYIYKPSN